MTPGGFRGRTFVAVVLVAVVAIGVASALTLLSLRAQLSAAIERTLVAEAKLAGALMTEWLRHNPETDPDLEADRIGRLTAARVTLVAPDGRVVGDSVEDATAIASMENHAARPEVVAASRGLVGTSRRHSDTVGTDLLYAAVRLDHPRVGVVRLALPLTDVDTQVASVRRSMLSALAVAIVCAVGLAWVSSLVLSRRVQRIAASAQRYAAGDFSWPIQESGSDELGVVARTLDDIVQQLGRKLDEIAQDRARMEAILAGMLEGVLVLDAQGRVLLVNDAARRLLRANDLAPGQHHLEVLRHPDVGALLAIALSGGAPEGLEFSPPRDPNRTIVARAAAVTTGPTRSVVLVLHDISDLRRADRMRRDFVANVSHELRTPLTAIQGYVEALLDEMPEDDGDTRRFLGIIQRHSVRMERLVRDLLRLARLEAGQEAVERITCSTESVFGSVVTELASAIEDRAQRVVTTVAPDAASLLTDAGKLHDVFRNLVENAVAYAPQGTTIRLDADRQGEWIRLRVSDEGPGIPEADLARIFERFYRVDKARSRESGGTGLGLSIVKHLVSLLGGDVQAANGDRGGAVFTVRLPATAD